jgi:outer membrane murein-binding lipoprotein Lpp
MKKILLVISLISVLLLAGCNKNGKTDDVNIPEDTNNQQQEIVENISNNQREGINDSGYSNEQLIEMAKQYRKAKGEYIPEFVEITEEKGNIVKIHLYDMVEDHVSTSDWYDVDRFSGKGINVLNEDIDLSPASVQELISSQAEDKKYISLNNFNIEKLKKTIDVNNFEFDKEYLIGYTKLDNHTIIYSVFYKKTKQTAYYDEECIEDYIILKNGQKSLEICLDSEVYEADYIEEISVIDNGNIIALATYNHVGDTSQGIRLYDYNLNLVKAADYEQEKEYYDYWLHAIAYEHQYGYDIINDKLIFYKNVGNEKVTYQIDVEKDDDMYGYTYHITEISRTNEGLQMGAGRT